MKRILAVFLTLAMALNIAPVAAFAAADSDAASIVAVEETDEPSSSQLDEETARAIVSDPFLQAASAQTEQEQEQTSQAKVDTSDVSMEATDSFGKLLLAGMDEQQTNGTGDGTKKIIGVTVSGNTATVEYVSDQIENLVVAIYTDDTEQEMVASGRIATFFGYDGKARTDEVKLTGDIPSSFVVKAYLLDYNTYEPLCNAFVSNQYTGGMQELEDATINDFDEARTINLDGDVTTNFAVVNEEVVLVDASRDEVAMEISDNGDGSYTITNADEKTRNLKKGDIFVYRADDGILVLKIEQIFAADSTVTIFGNENLELAEVFDVVKLQSYDDGSQLEYDGAGVDSDVHYQGAGVVQDPLEETNKLVGDLADGDFSASVAQKFVIGTDNFYKGKKEDVNDETHITSKFGINAVLNLKMTAKFQYLFNVDKQTMTFTFDSEISGGLEAKYASDIRVDLGVFKKEIPGVYLNYTPQFVFKGDVTGSFYYKLTQKQGYTLENRTITNISEKPVQEFSIKISGTIYLGVEFAPSLNIGIYKLFKPHTEENFYKLAGVKLMMSAGAEGTITSTILPERPEKDTILNVPHGDSIHECNTCLAADFYAKETMSVSIDIVGIWKTDVTIMDLREHIYTCYYSQDFGEFGEGKCPHKFYLVNISVESKEDPTGAELFNINKGSGDQSMGHLTGAADNYCYMQPGTYKLETTINNEKYGAIVKVKDKALDVVLKSYKGEGTGSTGGNSNNTDGYDPSQDSGKIIAQGSCGTGLSFTMTEGGLLRISGAGDMTDYIWNNIPTASGVHPYEWYFVKKVVIEEGVTGIGTDAFHYCKQLSEVALPSTLKKIGNGAFTDCEKLKSIVIPDGVTLIDMNVFSRCTSLQNVTIPVSVKTIDLAAFYGCDELTDVFYTGTEKQWKKVEIVALNDPFGSTKMHIHYNSNANGQPDDSSTPKVEQQGVCGKDLRWVLMSNGVVTISGTGEMVDITAFNKQSWFTTYADDITQVVIEEGVTTIGAKAFDNCVNLESVKLPNSLTEIHKYAFRNCESLWDIAIPDGVTQIMTSAFYKCTSLITIKIPDNAKIGETVFSQCESLKEVTLPETMTSINSGTFYKCRALTSIKIPKNVTTIGEAAFEKSGLIEIELPRGATYIGTDTFHECVALKQIVLPDTIRTIKTGAFNDCPALESIVYLGTESQWKKVTIGTNAIPESAAVYYRTEGSATENSITTGTATKKSGTYYAAFENAKAGKEYVVLVSREKYNPFGADSLIYINQITADADGELAVPFITTAGAEEMKYIVACAQDDATVEPGKPDNPGGDKPSSGGGDGGGAAIILIGGVAAVAAVAGVVLMMPVEVSGTVKIADQPVANASVQVLKNGSVTAQTTTDANGHFTVKVKRGDYTLRVQWTDAEGQPVERTVDFKAPNANLNVAA